MADKQTIKALEEFVQNVYWTKSLSAEQSIKNLEESLVEVLYPNMTHKGNGLLITENGYLLTANHVEEEDGKDCPSAKYIRNYQNKIYPIKKICQTDEREDLALLKADIAKEKVQKRYKVHNTNKLENFDFGKFPVNLKTRRDEKIKNKYGCLLLKYGMGREFNYTNLFGTDIPVDKGESGGIVISAEGELVGLLSLGFQKENQGDLYGGWKIRSYYSKIFSGLNLVVREINSLKGF